MVVVRGLYTFFGFLLNMLGGRVLGVALAVALFFLSVIFGFIFTEDVKQGSGAYTFLLLAVLFVPLIMCGRFAFFSLFAPNIDTSLYLMRELAVKMFLWGLTVAISQIVSQATGNTIWSYVICILYMFTIAPFKRLSDFIWFPDFSGSLGAAYAKPKDLNDMLISPKDQERHNAVLLGLAPKQNQLYALRSGHGGRAEMGHVLITGPTRSGKGRNLTTNLLNWSGSSITLDIKGENYENTATTREALGKVYRLDPSNNTHRFDPFKAMSYSDEGLKALANIILDSGEDKEQVFAQRATAALFAGIKASLIQRQATLPYLEELTGKGIISYCTDLWATNDKTVQRNLVQFLGVQPDQIEADKLLQDRFLMSSWQTLVTRLDPLFSEGILNMFSGNDFEAQDLVTEPSSLYLIFSESDFDSTQKAFQIIMLSLMLSLIRYYDNENQNTTPLLWCLDEAGRVPIPRLPELIATIAGRNMSALLYIQTLSQLESAYGRDKAATLRDNCRTQLYHPTSDTTTQDYIIKQAGKYESFQTSYSNSTTSEGTSSSGTSHSLKEKNLISNDEIRMQDPDTIYIFTANKAPILAQRLEPWMLD